jgi:hypothetical protein
MLPNISRFRKAALRLLAAAVIANVLTAAQPAPVADAHDAPSTCDVTVERNTGYKKVFIYHVRDGEALWLTIDGVTQRRIYRGLTQYWVVPPPPGQDIVQPLAAAAMNALKRVPAALSEHAGAGERGLIVETEPDADGLCRIGIVNERIQLGLEVSYRPEQLPRMAHWQHYGPRGAYATALEPFYGSLLGSARDRHPLVHAKLEPGESRRYQLGLRVLPTWAACEQLIAFDGPVQD